jgi:translation initiation factor 1
MGKDWKERLGIVYSTNPDFKFENGQAKEEETLPPDKQTLKVSIDRKQRKGKTVTLVQNFIGSRKDLTELGKLLKTKCGTGGSEKDGTIIIQGDFCEKVKETLKKEGFKIK